MKINKVACGILTGLMIFGLSSCEKEEQVIRINKKEHVHTFTTLYDEKSHYEKCTICGYETEHENHAIVYKHDEKNHWQACRYCDYKIDSSLEAHVLENGHCPTCNNFNILSFGFTQGGDAAHADFAREANIWFEAKGKELGFTYDFVGTDWSKLNDDNLVNYDLVIFLNGNPGNNDYGQAFKRYVDNGGAWMGFHVTPFCQAKKGTAGHWDWFQDEFVGCGDYGDEAHGKYNTWDPTSEPMTIVTHDFCATKHIKKDKFIAAACEWYAWSADIGANPDIQLLLTLDPTEDNPAGDDPRPGKEFQIWKSGSYPIAWTNKNYNMVYMNWGHNLRSYDLGEEGKASKTFASPEQCTFMLDSMFGLVGKKKN